MKRILLTLLTALFVLFIAPALASLAWHAAKQGPTSWRNADWTSAGLLPRQLPREGARIHVMSARTGGLKGALAAHSWLLIKKPGATQFDRYDVVGWGRPVRRNAYAPDGRWFSNPPRVDATVEGEEAARLIPKLEAAIAAYRFSRPGDYTIWPGPNSNTFVAEMLRAVPELDLVTDATAVGRDYPGDGRWLAITRSEGFRASLGGYAGLAIGPRVGLELNFLGLVTGVNPRLGAVKLPGFGTYSLWGDGRAKAAEQPVT